MLQATGGGFSVLSDSFTSLWPASFELFACLDWTLVLAPWSFFSPFLGWFLFIKFGRTSSLHFKGREGKQEASNTLVSTFVLAALVSYL
jgi:hypothetical protein